MTITYNDVHINANSKDCSIREFYDVLWQYVKDEMKEILKSGNIDAQLVKILINYRGDSCGVHAMLLDMGFAELYEEVQDLIREYAIAHEEYQRDFYSYSLFEAHMADYIEARNIKKNIVNEIHNNPLIKNLLENGHCTFANQAVCLLANDDERTKSANKKLRNAMYGMRAKYFFRILEKVVKELGE